ATWYRACHVCFLFFFFQAEDGIRDFHVTGVQTCALPIFNPAYLQTGNPAAFAIRAILAATMSPSWGVYSGYELFEHEPLKPGGRSEERRVGKEGRSRWSPYR